MIALGLLLLIPVLGMLFLARRGDRAEAGVINVRFNAFALAASLWLAVDVLLHGPALSPGRMLYIDSFNVHLGVLTAFVGWTTSILLRAVHGTRTANRPGHHAAFAALLCHVSGLHAGHVPGVDHQQYGRALGSDGRGDPGHRAAGQLVPHARIGGGGLEIFHPLQRRHRPGPVRHGTPVFRRRAETRCGRRGFVVDGVARQRPGSRSRHPESGRRFLAGRLRHQDRSGAPASMAARCPFGRSDADVRHPLGAAPQRCPVCGGALQDAGGWLARHAPGGPPDDGLRPVVLPGRSPVPAPPDGHQAPVQLFLDRTHGLDDLRFRHRQSLGHLRRPVPHDHPFVDQIGHLRHRGSRRTIGRHPARGEDSRPDPDSARHRLGTSDRHRGHRRFPALRRVRQRISGPGRHHAGLPVVDPLLLLGVGLAFAGLFRHIQPMVYGEVPEGQQAIQANLTPVMVHLALVLWLGLSIPAFLGNWFNQATLLISGAWPQ